MNKDCGKLIKILILMSLMIFALGIQCSSKDRKGPFKLDQQRANISAPSKTTLRLERAKIVKDVTIAILQRAFHSSYCYQGGPLDPNTSCFTGITQNLPGYEETSEWVTRGKCAVGPDCTDCWGSDSKICLNPQNYPKRWVDKKEIIIASNNNHFAFHTCNLSWKCSIHTTDFPTFIKVKNNRYTYYTEYLNGTELNLDSKDFWTMHDIVLKKVTDPILETTVINASCFNGENKTIACYDNELGNFVEFTGDWKCTGNTCYKMNKNYDDEITSNKVVDLKAASKEDLHRVIEIEHMLNEELRYNFGLVLEELADLRAAIIKVVLSTSKIDDQLMGSILGHNVRSQFVNEEIFYLSPCKNIEANSTNCKGDLTFRNGRWQENNNQSECIIIANASTINLLQPKELWFPEIIDTKPIGTVENFDGWTYYAREQDSLQKAMQWTKNLQSTTSLADIANYPQGFIEGAITGFITLHSIAYGVLALIIIYLYKKIHATTPHQSFREPGVEAIQLQNIITVLNKEPPTGNQNDEELITTSIKQTVLQKNTNAISENQNLNPKDEPIQPIETPNNPTFSKPCVAAILNINPKDEPIQPNTTNTKQTISTLCDPNILESQPHRFETGHPKTATDTSHDGKPEREDHKLGWNN